MNIYFNAATIFDMVVDHDFNRDQLQAIAHQLYADKRGGELAHLHESEEFMASLNEQLA
jgi:hypothetical protein